MSATSTASVVTGDARRTASAPRSPWPARLASGAGVLLAVLLQLLPFYITVTSAMKARSDLSSQWLPPFTGVHWQNFATAIEQGGILRAIGNSAIVTLGATVLVCVLGALAAYPLARRPTIGNKLVLAGVVGLIMIPPLSILVPLYSMMSQWHAINTYWGTILVMTATQLPLAIFLYTAFMRGLPISIEEAASVDGANAVQVLFRVVVPMLKPVTATVVILTSVNVWNDYALSVYLMRSPEMRTIAPATATFFSTTSSDVGAAAAASLLSALPVLIVYLVLQKYFIKGMVAGSEK